jgi:hypothetical protein
MKNKFKKNDLSFNNELIFLDLIKSSKIKVNLMNSESKSKEDGEMDIQGIVCKYLLGYLHGETKKLSQTVFNTYSKVYNDSIRSYCLNIQI